MQGVGHHRKKNDIPLGALESCTVAAQDGVVLHQLLADDFRKLGANVLGLVRSNQRDHPNRTVPHRGLCRQRFNFLNDDVRLGTIDLAVLLAPAVR
jgi:hypothetical protein